RATRWCVSPRPLTPRYPTKPTRQQSRANPTRRVDKTLQFLIRGGDSRSMARCRPLGFMGRASGGGSSEGTTLFECRLEGLRGKWDLGPCPPQARIPPPPRPPSAPLPALSRRPKRARSTRAVPGSRWHSGERPRGDRRAGGGPYALDLRLEPGEEGRRALEPA